MIAMIEINFLFALISFYFVMYGYSWAQQCNGFGIRPKNSGSQNYCSYFGHYYRTYSSTCPRVPRIRQSFSNGTRDTNYFENLCSAYMVYLSYKIIGSFSTIEARDKKPIKFHEAALFQLINPKAWTISSMAASGSC